jgi:antitoxin MazE
MKAISTTDLRQNLASILNTISNSHEELVVTGAGRDPIIITSESNFVEGKRNASHDMFNLARLQILQLAGIQINDELVPNAYLFAWLKGVYPIIHDGGQGELKRPHEFCKDDFIIPEKIVETISDFLDNRWDEPPTFYELEQHFDSSSRLPHHYDRGSLILTCRYLYLGDGFYPDFWEKLLTPNEFPAEAVVITKSLEKKEITI